MNRRAFLGLFTRAAAAAPFAAMLPRWYGTAAQWAIHAKEGVLRLAAHGRLVRVPEHITLGTMRRQNAIFIRYQDLPGHPVQGLDNHWLGQWQSLQGRVLMWADHQGRYWWAKP